MWATWEISGRCGRVEDEWIRIKVFILLKKGRWDDGSMMGLCRG
jgi:hypothetical protein